MVNPNNLLVTEAVSPPADTADQFAILPEVASNAKEIITETQNDTVASQTVPELAEPAKRWENPVFAKTAEHSGSIMGAGLVATNTVSILSKTATAAGIEHASGTMLPVGELWRFATTNYNAFQRTLGEVVWRGEGQFPAAMTVSILAAMGLSTAVRSWRKRKAEKVRRQEVLPPELLSEADQSILK